MAKKISANCLNLVKEFEGLQLKAYRDEVGIWTIGYGITNSDKAITGVTIRSGLTISKATAVKWLEESLNKKYLPKVLKYDSKYNWTQNELDALVSFCYNVGSIKALTSDGTRTKEQIASKLLEYNKAGGRVYAGLTRRRKAEQALFLTPVFTGEYRGTLHDPLITGTVKVGVKGSTVVEVQAFINHEFGADIKTDGDCGKITESYIKKFQTYKGLEADGKWGHKTYVAAKNATIKDRFMCHLIYINEYVRNHGSFIEYSATSPDKSLKAFRDNVNKGEKGRMNCIAPAYWTMLDMGFTISNFYAKLGSFGSKYSGDLTKYATKYTSGHGIGKTVRNAVDGGLLRPGDIICFEGLTHTFVYTGKGYKMYDAGSASDNRGYSNVGITLDYTLVTAYKERRISEIIRWK